MHQNNISWLNSLRARFPDAFTGSVLEVGSDEPERVTRSFFPNALSYTGIDLVESDTVDIVEDFNEHDFGVTRFDTIVMLSVFEHDPRWDDTLANGIQLLKDGGYLIVGFGAEGNTWHPPEPWSPVPHMAFIAELCDHDVAIIEAFFEEEMFGRAVSHVECFDALIRKGNSRRDVWPTSPGRFAWQDQNLDRLVAGPNNKLVSGEFQQFQSEGQVREGRIYGAETAPYRGSK